MQWPRVRVTQRALDRLFACCGRPQPWPNGDWAGTHLTRSVTDAPHQHLFVYTDIEAPSKRVQFYNFDRQGDDSGARTTDMLINDGTAPPPTVPTPTVRDTDWLIVRRIEPWPATLVLSRHCCWIGVSSRRPVPEEGRCYDQAVSELMDVRRWQPTAYSTPGQLQRRGWHATRAPPLVRCQLPAW